MGWKAIGSKLLEYSKSVEMDWEVKEKDATPDLFSSMADD